MAKYTIAGRQFASKKAVEDECRRIRDAYAALTPVREAEDFAFLLGVLRLHRDAAEKIGPGVRAFWSDYTTYGTRGFWLERLDGTKTDWSFLHALKHPSRREEALSALRNEIRYQIEDFRDRAFAGKDFVVCGISGQPVGLGEHHVDHVTPFNSLAEAFVAQYKAKLEDIEIQPSRDNSVTRLLQCQEDREAWQRFHAQRATLRIVSIKANLSRPRSA